MTRYQKIAYVIAVMLAGAFLIQFRPATVLGRTMEWLLLCAFVAPIAPVYRNWKVVAVTGAAAAAMAYLEYNVLPPGRAPIIWWAIAGIGFAILVARSIMRRRRHDLPLAP